jgi:hypothetical protein
VLGGEVVQFAQELAAYVFCDPSAIKGITRELQHILFAELAVPRELDSVKTDAALEVRLGIERKLGVADIYLRTFLQLVGRTRAERILATHRTASDTGEKVSTVELNARRSRRVGRSCAPSAFRHCPDRKFMLPRSPRVVHSRFR